MADEEKKCNCKTFKGIAVIALLLSIVSLTLSILMITGNVPTANAEGKKVVISKQYDKGRSLDKAQKMEKPIIAFFYTDWCGFCQRFVPTFDKVTKNKKIKQNFAIAYVNCEDEANKAHVEKFGIKGFPTVYVIKQDGEKVQLDNNTFFNSDSKDVVAAKALEIIGIEAK